MKSKFPSIINFLFNQLYLKAKAFCNSLFANFYRTIDFKDLDINLKKSDFYEVIKCLIIRKRLQNLIILTKNQYIDNKIYLPIISKIYINNKTSRKLVETLKEISNKFKVEVINYEDDNF